MDRFEAIAGRFFSGFKCSLFNSGWVQNEIHGFLHGTEPPNATREDHYSRPRLLYLGKYI